MFSIYADGQLVCSSEVLNEDMYAIDPDASVVCELDNKAGSFNFAMYPTHYLYDKLRNYTTEVEVWLDNECIFTGRVMNSTVSLTDRNVYCEGALSYFNDSIQPKFEKKTTTPRVRFKEIIEEHNKQVDIFKRFSVGTVDIKDADVADDFELTGATNTFSTLSSDLIDRFGGYLRVYRSDNLLRVDWVTNYNHICAQPINFGENLVSYSENDGIDDAWSILYPTASGADDVEYSIASANNGSPYYELPERIERFGRIIKTLDFDDIESDQALLDETIKWLEKNDILPDPTITISAVDLSVLFSDTQKFSIGDTISFRIWNSSDYRVLTCAKISYSLFKPGQVELTLGKPPKSLTDAYFSDKEELDSNISDTNDRIDTVEKETNSSVNSLTERIGDAERDLEINARDIEVNARNIQLNADAIAANVRELALKASDSELVELQKTTSGFIEKTDKEIEGLRQTTGRIATRLGAVELDVNGGEGTAGLKAQYAQIWGDQQALEGDMEAIRGQVDEVGEYVNDVAIEINAMKGQIELMATRKEVTDLGTRLNDVGITLDAVKADLLLKASTELVDKYQKEVSIDLDAMKAEIALKAAASVVDELTGRVVDAEGKITVNSQNINLSVRKDGVIAAINLSSEEARIIASKIVLDGYVTTSQLEAEVANLKELIGGDVHFSSMSVSGAAEVGSFKIGGNSVHTATVDVVTGVTLEKSTKTKQYVDNLNFETNYVHYDTAQYVSTASLDVATKTLYYWSYE